MRYTDLSTAAAVVKANTLVAQHLASAVEEIRYQLPEGYTTRPDADGVSRPVEAVVTANESRGVSERIRAALYELNVAAIATARAAHTLDAALTAWDDKR